MALAICTECYRRFDLADAAEASEYYHGHDCEPPEAGAEQPI